jgi:ubiquitin carboxyl-terminal hydrolase L5
MPPKSKKRRAPAKSNTTTANDDNALTPPDRNTWPGWVEMESEPAFFNAMLKDMGVHGVKTSEVWSLDDNDLAILPQPVHALIFLFRYRETDKDVLVADCPANVWYAEQVPDFACATVALLNIVNNIPNLEMGKDLRDFKDFTHEMLPRLKGEAIDDFAFVKKTHNSFAREVDILQADMHLKEKAAKARKRQAVAKGLKTKAENAARKAMSNSPAEIPKSTRTSGRVRRSIADIGDGESSKATPRSNQSSTKRSNISPADSRDADLDGNESTEREIEGLTATPSKTNGNTRVVKKSESPAVDSANTKEKHRNSDDGYGNSASVSTPAKPMANIGKKSRLNAPKTETNTSPSVEDEDSTSQPRRSGRQPQPRKDLQPAQQQTEDEAEEEDDEGFHFCAYMPIGDHVWKLDGMDKFPQNIGPVIHGESWLSIAQPVLQDRMAQYTAGSIEFNIMAVVHDPMVACVEALAANVKTLRAAEEKLTGVVDDWREMLDDKLKVPLLGQDPNLGLHNVDIERAHMTQTDANALKRADDLTGLLELRQELVLQQNGLRRACSDEMESVRSEAEKARDRRHDYSTFAKEWLGALAEQDMLGALLEEEEP